MANWTLLPAIDALADPENINTLVILSTHRDSSLSNIIEIADVPMLQSWLTVPITHSHIIHNYFKPSLDEILSDPQLLYMLMQHIKETGPMNLLQFCLDIGMCNFKYLRIQLFSNHNCVYEIIYS